MLWCALPLGSEVGSVCIGEGSPFFLKFPLFESLSLLDCLLGRGYFYVRMSLVVFLRITSFSPVRER